MRVQALGQAQNEKYPIPENETPSRRNLKKGEDPSATGFGLVSEKRTIRNKQYASKY